MIHLARADRRVANARCHTRAHLVHVVSLLELVWLTRCRGGEVLVQLRLLHLLPAHLLVLSLLVGRSGHEQLLLHHEHVLLLLHAVVLVLVGRGLGLLVEHLLLLSSCLGGFLHESGNRVDLFARTDHADV